METLSLLFLWADFWTDILFQVLTKFETKVQLWAQFSVLTLQAYTLGPSYICDVIHRDTAYMYAVQVWELGLLHRTHL